MKLKVIYATKEEIPEALVGYYIEKDGKFILDAEGVEDVGGLKSALTKEREGRRVAESALKAFREAGIEDPEVAAEAVRLAETLAKLDPSKDVDKIIETRTKAREQQLIEKHNKAVTTEQGINKRLLAQLDKVMIDNAAIQAIVKEKGATELLLPIIRQQTRLRQDGDRFFVEVLDGSGAPRIGDGSGNPMTIDQLVTEMKSSAIYGRAFEGSGATGSGGNARGADDAAGTGRAGVKVITTEGLGKGGFKLEDIASGKVVVTE